MKKFLVLAVLILSFFVSDAALACKPGGGWPPAPKDNVAQKDAVFVGTVQSVIQDRSVNGEYRISFSVDQKYKGTLGDTVIVKTQGSSAACGYDNGYDTFKAGSVWVIYATGNASEGYSTSSISVNTPYASVALATAAMTAAGVTVPNDDAPVMCTMQYAPVCGNRDTGIRCVTTPCPSFETRTYGNSCMLAADKAEFLYEGECKDAPAPVTIRPTPAPSAVTLPDSDAGMTIDGGTAVEGDAPAASVSLWQKFVIRIKTLFSFWK